MWIISYYNAFVLYFTTHWTGPNHLETCLHLPHIPHPHPISYQQTYTFCIWFPYQNYWYTSSKARAQALIPVIHQQSPPASEWGTAVRLWNTFRLCGETDHLLHVIHSLRAPSRGRIESSRSRWQSISQGQLPLQQNMTASFTSKSWTAIGIWCLCTWNGPSYNRVIML